MKEYGIYTLANDAVHDQLIALINSIEANVEKEIPICVIPYDNQLSLVNQVIAERPNVTLFDKQESLQRWEKFAKDIWATHPQVLENRFKKATYPLGHHRKFVAFDGEFKKFVFYDADSLAMKPLSNVFEKLDRYDLVFDDWEHKKQDKSTALKLDLVEKNSSLQREYVRSKLHCSSFFGSRSSLLNDIELLRLKNHLIKDQEIKWIRRSWDDAFLFNYLTLRAEYSTFNFTLSSNSQDRTGNCADSDPFIELNGILYNQDGKKAIHRIHYMNYPSKYFKDLAEGKDRSVAYKNIFLYYRFYKEPQNRPKTLQYSNLMVKGKVIFEKAAKKLSGILRSAS